MPKIKQKSDTLVMLSLEIKQKNERRFFLVCWYRPPTSAVDNVAFENLRESLGALVEEGNETIYVGNTTCDFKNTANVNTKQLKLVYSE